LLDTAPVAVALPVSNVLGVFSFAEWSDESPRRFNELVPVRFTTSKPEWVLRLTGSAQTMIALVSGMVRVEYLGSDMRLSMPSLDQQATELFLEVVLADGKPSALVVNVDALFRASRKPR
jgi:hypothetical protein